MNKNLVGVSFVILAILTGIFFSVFLSNVFQISAQKTAQETWEYGEIRAIYYFEPNKQRIDKIFGIVEFCQMTSNGCSRSEIRYELDYGKFLKQKRLQENFNSRGAASLRASEIAFQKALSQLGKKGWQLIGEPEKEFQSINLIDYEQADNKSLLITKQNTRSIYFKRLK